MILPSPSRDKGKGLLDGLPFPLKKVGDLFFRPLTLVRDRSLDESWSSLPLLTVTPARLESSRQQLPGLRLRGQRRERRESRVPEEP